MNSCFNPFAPGDFAEKRVLKLLWSLSCYKELKLTTKPFTGRTLRGLLIQMLNISCKVRACAESKAFGFKSDTAVLTFTFHLLSGPLFSLLLPQFFSLAGYLVGFILEGKVFRKAFRILGLDERKGRWVVEQDFRIEIFKSMLHGFLLFSVVSLTEVVVILVLFERSLHSAQVSGQSCP